MDTILSLDAGTGSIRAVLFDTEGRQLACAQQEWSHPSDPSFPGSMNFDVEHNWRLVTGCIRELLTLSKVNPASIRAISAASMREGFVIYDSRGSEIWACANVDSRAGAEVLELQSIRESFEKEIYLKTGQTFALGALPRLLWLKKYQPDIYERAAAITMLNDWMLYRLSGVLQADPSNGCTTGMFSLETRTWDPSIATGCGLKEDLFPPVHEAGTVIGAVTEKASAETGLAAGTTVVSGGGDAQLASIGVGVVKDGQAFVCGGSFWQQEVNISRPEVDHGARIRVNCHAVPSLWQYETIAFYPGLVMRWFRDAFCQEEKREADARGLDVYEVLEEKAARVPAGSHGIMPIYSDVMNFISWRHASPSFINLTLDPDICGKKEMFRAIEENAALVTLGNLKLIEKVSGRFPHEVVFAGGAAKGRLWPQILADVLGIKVKVPVVKEAAALGAAIAAGVGAGIYPSMEDASGRLVKWEAEYHPDPKTHSIYKDVFSRWQKIYKHQLQLADEGWTEHMWKAPGAEAK
ncbi:autoinducer-2 kinase [Peribacillus sp. SCS-26]|uniref:autoinducer-2 kinase n=1 Tax=Paraperibacillus marinus TaxID=3115295 RepID=UPI003905EEEE